jgi:uncharacterized protein YuzE
MAISADVFMSGDTANMGCVSSSFAVLTVTSSYRQKAEPALHGGLTASEVNMKISKDMENNVGYVKILPNGKVAYSVDFEKNFVTDFDANNNLVGIELLDARSYQPGDLQSLMSKANAEALKLRDSGETDKLSA